MNDRASHRAAVEAGYADLAGYVAKYREPEYPGASIRTARLIWPSTGELGEVRLMDYGSNSKKRYRVAAFCPGRTVELPGDTPKVEPEADNWCALLAGANAWFDLYVDRERRDGWEDAAERPDFDRETLQARDRTRPSLHGDGHVGPVARLARELDDAKVITRARAVVSQSTPAHPLSTRRYIDARAAVLAAMKWAADNA
jgi:hypothetical protein